MLSHALQYIPAAYALAFLPHAYYISANLGTTGKWGNTSPRQNWDGLEKKLPQDLYARCVRARNAHLNALEQAPLFAAAILAGIVMKMPAAELNHLGVQYIIARLAYTVLYIYTSNEALSFARTLVWGWSAALPIMAILRAATL